MKSILSMIDDFRIRQAGRTGQYLGLIELIILKLIFIISVLIFKTIIRPGWIYDPVELLIFLLLMIISWYVLSRLTNLAKLPRTQRYLFLVLNSLRSHFYVLLVLAGLKYLFLLQSVPLIFIFCVVSFTSIVLTTMRFIVYRILKIYRASGYDLHNVLLIADSFSEVMIDKLNSQKEWGFNIAGIITKSRMIKAKYEGVFRIYPDTANIKEILDGSIIDEVIYCSSQTDEREIVQIFNVCKEVGILFRLQSAFAPLDPINFQLKTIYKTNDLRLVDIPSSNSSIVFKVMSDLYFAITATILLSPLFILIALLIRLDSRGQVLFIQERIGLRGRKFRLYKFRTMIADADKMISGLMDKNQSDGPVFKIKDDPRITRVGRFLRKTGLDELPQLFNVIKGEMSLIGPRPPLASEVQQYERWQLRRLSVKPGITCSWQIVPNRNDVKFENWMKMDLNYIDNWTISKDIRLFFKTVTTVISASGR